MPFERIKGSPPIRRVQRRIDRAREKYLRELAAFIVAEHRKIVADWDTDVEFKVEFFREGKTLKFRVVVENDVWNWVNFGTGLFGPRRRKIKIRPKRRGGRLRYLPIYNPHTTPTRHGGSGTKSGDPVFARAVEVKGIKPRRFDLKVAKMAEDKFYPEWPKVMKRAIFG